MRAVIVFAVAASISVSAQPTSAPVWMTGTQLLALLTFPAHIKGNLDMSPAQYLDAERARLYIEGVHDLSAGKSWCYSRMYPPAPDTVRDAVVMGLRSLPPEQLRRNAAELMVDIWRKRWPCGRAGSAR